MRDEIADALGLDRTELAAIAWTGPTETLPARLPVTELCASAVAAGLAAARDLSRVRRRQPGDVTLDRAHLAASMRSERHVRIEGAPPSAAFDPLSRFLRTIDGWIRLHGNYPAHRAAAQRVLGVGIDASATDLEQAAGRWRSDELEDAVIEAGGCAAALRSEGGWAAHPQGAAVAAEPLIDVGRGASGGRRLDEVPPGSPAAGVRVLDLTRVIAGPAATRQLAAAGADVLRIDPPDLPELPLAWSDFALGKRSLHLDLADAGRRRTFDLLLAEADAVVVGYRPGGMAALGLDPDALARRVPGLIVVALDAWGWTGPWAGRRGFDSLVQSATGIAQVEGDGGTPGVLPAQALDHATGHLAAAAVLRGLAQRQRSGHGSVARLSLARTAALLLSGQRRDEPTGELPDAEPFLTTVDERTAAGARPVTVVAPMWGTWPSGAPQPGSGYAAWPKQGPGAGTVRNPRDVRL